MILTPVELLQKELNTLERDFQKSREMFIDKKISLNKHKMHKSNLFPKIIEYQLAINILKDYDERNPTTET